MQYYIGVDIGTTSSKAVAFNNKEEVIESHSIGYKMEHLQAGWSEQDPDEILAAVIECINTVINSLTPGIPSFVSFGAAMHSLLVIDDTGTPITPCIIWADNRAADLAEQLRYSKKGHLFYQETGVPIHSMSPLCKILWLKENDDSIFKSAYKFIGIKEYIFFKLTNTYKVDTSIASATGMLHLNSLQWHAEILEYIGISSSQLSEVVPVKYTAFYNENYTPLKLSKGVPIVIGASDGALANLGTGASEKGILSVTIGTSGAARLMVSAPITDELMRTFCYHVKDELYVAGGATNNGAVVLQWLKEEVLQSKERFDVLYEQASSIPPGSDGLLFVPYLLGERAPIWNAKAKGIMVGISIEHTRAHFIRSAIEGVIFCLYSIGKVLSEYSIISEIRASGGFARSTLWLQILADVFNLKVISSPTVESSALGAVRLGAETLNLPLEVSDDPLNIYYPDRKNNSIYSECFVRFTKVYQKLKELS